MPRKTKIVATLGPASNTVEVIANLINAGMNVARVNMSHGTHEGHAQLIKNIREASAQTEREVAILVDLQGPKIRVDKLPQPLKLEVDELWYIGPSHVKEKYPEYKDRFIPTIYERLVHDVSDGDMVLFDDGKMVARSIKKDREVLEIKIRVGGELKSNKGINLPDSDVTAPSLTEKDREDFLFAITQDVDYFALSFVRKAEDILQLKRIMDKHNIDIPIVAKIEKPQAIENLEEILQVADGIMVARGDMGVEVGNHLVPGLQKKIINESNRKGIPVITATQMLESMIDCPTPTRAEASDVANAIWDGTDAVMLSAESASGKYAIESVKMMDKIAREAEKTPKERPFLRNVDLSSINASTMVAGALVAEKINAKKILCFTESGASCRKMARFRPINHVLGITPDLKVIRKICLYWGITPFPIKNYDGHDPAMEKKIINEVRDRCLLLEGDRIVLTRGGGDFFANGYSNSVRVDFVSMD